MNQYKIYENPLGNREAVKQGWSWPAFFFRWIWAFVKKLNTIGGITLGGIILANIVSGAVMSAADDDGAGTLETLFGLALLAIPVIFGVNGNSWREQNLRLRAYEVKATITAASDETALAMYFTQLQQQKQGQSV